MLKERDQIPMDIQIKDESGESVSLKKYLRKYLVIYFYPKDNTLGCTKEACEFRDMNIDIKNLGADIVGISKDSNVSHQKFKAKHSLNFELLSDPDHKLQEAFGVWQPKKFMGREYMGTQRSTFVVDSNGVIIKTWKNVIPLGHASQVYNFLKEHIKF